MQIRAPKRTFDFHSKIGIESDIFVYFNLDSKSKIENKKIFNFQFLLKNKIFVFRCSIVILFPNTKLPTLIKLSII